ncbi:tripartite motif-containing protein 2-like [Glandiceps talaboti]
MASKEVQFLKKINEDFLHCTICSGRYKNAKCLPCLHNFCESCLVKLVGEDGVSIICPTCRRKYELPENGVTGIAANFFLDQLVEMFQKRDETSDESSICQGCKKYKSSMHCIECSTDICENCVLPHKELPATRTHRVVTRAEYTAAKSDDPASVQPPLYCTRHPNYEVEFYCEKCDSAICLKCTALDHRGHEYGCIKDACKVYTEYLRGLIDKVKMKEAEANVSKQAVRNVSESLEDCYLREERKTKEHIEKTIDEITRLIKENGDKLLKELRDEYNTRKVNLNAQIKGLEIAESDLSNTIEYTENLLRYGNAAQVMYAKKGVSTQMDELLKVETTTEPTENDYMEFQPCNDFCRDKSVGALNNVMTYKVTATPKFVRVDEDIVITIATESTKHKVMSASGRLEVDAVMTTPDKSTEKVEVNDNKDGTLTLKSRGQVEGEHELSVSVHKKPVEGSPVRIQVIRKKGLVSKFGIKGSGIGQLNKPCGVTLTRGNVLVSDSSNHRLQTFSQGGNTQSVFKFTNVGNKILPADTAISVDGNTFITDAANNQVLVCDENGKLSHCFGKGQFQNPIGIALSAVNGRVYIVDNRAHCILIYCQDGNYINSFGCYGSKDGELHNPVFLCIDDKGNIYVADQYNHRIQVFNADGLFLYSFGNRGSGDGQMNRPFGVCCDKVGYVYVADHGNSRVLKFEAGGKFVSRVDTGGLSGPWGLCVTSDEPFPRVIVANTGNDCVKICAQ